MIMITAFQKLFNRHIGKTEDAGAGMRNLDLGDKIVQVYPNNEFHDVWILRWDDEGEIVTRIGELSIREQWRLFFECVRTLNK